MFFHISQIFHKKQLLYIKFNTIKSFTVTGLQATRAWETGYENSQKSFQQFWPNYYFSEHCFTNFLKKWCWFFRRFVWEGIVSLLIHWLIHHNVIYHFIHIYIKRIGHVFSITFKYSSNHSTCYVSRHTNVRCGSVMKT